MTRRRFLPSGDSGFTLTEVMVGSAIMATTMAIATGGIVVMYQTTDRTEAAASAQTNLMGTFSRLDREVRYAYRVSDPYALNDGATFAIDYVIPDQDNVRQCVQLSMPATGGTLTRRQWSQTSTGSGPATTAGAIAENLVPATANTNPFTKQTASGTNYDQLRINVNSTVGLGDHGDTRNYDLTFTALNTSPTDNLTCTK